MTFTLLPAVDVSQGQAVRLDKGEAGTETSYGSPRDAAQKWRSQGANWLHFVDLDAAFGRGSNHEEMAMIIRELGVNAVSYTHLTLPTNSVWCRCRGSAYH